jgi:hypothetical protein
MSSELRRPIILFGNTRSGTTIVQKVVSSHPMWRNGMSQMSFGFMPIPEEFMMNLMRAMLRAESNSIFANNFSNFKDGMKIAGSWKNAQNILRIRMRAILPEATFLFHSP